jgi:hypothetical protein
MQLSNVEGLLLTRLPVLAASDGETSPILRGCGSLTREARVDVVECLPRRTSERTELYLTSYDSLVPEDADSNLDRVAAAYGVDPPSVAGVANEVIGRATDTRSGAGHALTWGENEYGAVVDVILAVVETPGVVQALADGDDIPQGFVIEAEGRVWPEGRHESMPALAMVELVITDIRHAFGADGD